MTTSRNAQEDGLYTTAIHEAGHAVIAFEAEAEGAQVPVGSVSIIPKGDSLGRMIHEALRKGVLGEQDATLEVEQNRQFLIMVCLAGAVAVSVAEQRKSAQYGLSDRVPIDPDFDESGAKDHRMALDYALNLSGAHEEALPLVAWLTEKTSTWVQYPSTWHAIEALAQRLIALRTMSGDDARAVWGQAKRSFDWTQLSAE